MNTSLRRAVAATFNPTTAGLSLTSGAANTYALAAATSGVIGGKFGTPLASGAGKTTPTTDVNTGAAFAPLQPNYGTVFVWGVNAAGAAVVARGSTEPLVGGVTTTPGSFANSVPQFPVLPDDFCPIAYTVLKGAPSMSPFTFGSGNWNASGLGASTVNICTLPDRPQVA